MAVVLYSIGFVFYFFACLLLYLNIRNLICKNAITINGAIGQKTVIN